MRKVSRRFLETKKLSDSFWFLIASRALKMDFDLKEVKISREDEAKLNKKQRDAFRRRYKTENPNVFDPKAKRTVFEKILRTPNNVDDINWCIKHGADLYAVSSELCTFLRLIN